MSSAFVTSSVSRNAGGLFFAMKSMSGSLHQMGVDVSVHGVLDVHSLRDAHEWQPVPCRVHPHIGPAALAWSPTLAQDLLAGEYDLLHTHGLWQGPSAAVHRWHKNTGKSYLISPHGMLDPWAVSQSRWKKRIVSVLFESAHLRDAACIHALCQSEADSIRAYGLKNAVCIIPNGIDLPAEKPETRSQRPEKKRLLFLGRLHPKKGLPNALRAWSKIRGQGSGGGSQEEWQFVIAGWDQGGHEAELKQLCDELGLKWADIPAAEFVGASASDQEHLAPLATSGRAAAGTPYRSSETPKHRNTETPASVIFTGPAFGEAKDALLRQAHAFILPSFSEGLPMSVLEAWSYRLPVLMTDHCNIPEGFAADAAIRIDTDVESIAEGLHSLLASRVPELAAMGGRGRSLVERQFTWPQVAAQMKEVYEWILGGGDNPEGIV